MGVKSLATKLVMSGESTPENQLLMGLLCKHFYLHFLCKTRICKKKCIICKLDVSILLHRLCFCKARLSHTEAPIDLIYTTLCSKEKLREPSSLNL